MDKHHSSHLRRILFFLALAFSTAFGTISAQTANELNEWIQKGQEAEEAKSYDEAIRYYELFREGYGQRYSQEDEDYGLVLFYLARCHSYTGNYAKAVEYQLKESEITLAVFGPNHEEYGASMQNLSTYYAQLGDHVKAVEYGKMATAAYLAALGDQHPKYAQSLHNLARFHSDIGEYAEAVRLETMAMQIHQTTLGTAHPDYAASLHNLSAYHSLLGDYAKAVEYGAMEQELEAMLSGEQTPEYASSLDNMAQYYTSLGDYTKAVGLCAKALRIRQKTLGTSHPDYAASLSNMANNYAYLGDYKKAIDLGTKALSIRRKALGSSHPDYAMSLSNMAHYYFSMGNSAKAIEYGQQAMLIWEGQPGGPSIDYASCLNNLANYHAALGEYTQAVEYCTRAAEVRKALLGEQHPDYAQSLNSLASILYRHGEFKRAKEVGEQTMNIYRTTLGETHPTYAMALNNLAGYYAILGDYDNGLRFFSQNIQIVHANILQQFAGLTSKQRSLFWGKESYGFTDLFPSYAYLSHASTAPDLYDKSCLFAKGLLLTTEIEMNRLIQESGDQEALKMFEELQLNRMQLQQTYETPIAERHINADSLARTVNRQERALVRRSKVYGDFTERLRTTWKDVQAALDDNEIAVEFLSFDVYGTDSVLVAALTLRKDDKEPRFIPLFEQRQLAHVSDPTFFNCPETTDLIWKPIQQELRGVKRIYFSPAGTLHTIGIEYAPGMEEYEMYRLSTTREVIDLKRLGQTTPAPLEKEGSKVTPMAALFGGIDYNASLANVNPSMKETGNVQSSLSDSMGEIADGDMSIALHRAFVDSLDVRGLSAKPLPATLAEVEAIKQSFDKKRMEARLFTDKAATETSIKGVSGHNPHILHIATHGFYFTAKQAQGQSKMRFLTTTSASGGGQGEAALTRSGLLFAGANGALQGLDIPLGEDDGILTAQEISHLDLRGVDLVVLSACQTGKGDINQGEGVFGLQRGFKKAGAKTIVMSLWEVADEATQILMTSFYDQLILGKSKRQAFREAQQQLRSYEGGVFDHPQFWAAFVLLD